MSIIICSFTSAKNIQDWKQHKDKKEYGERKNKAV